MEFWALAYKYEDGNFYDFKLKYNEVYLKDSCLLPTQEMAENYIRDNLSNAYTVVKVKIHSYADEGKKLGYLMTRLPEWHTDYRY